MLTYKGIIYDELFEKQDGRCVLCDEKLTDRYHTHIDRIDPGADGGAYIIENCQLICLKCEWEKEGIEPDSRYPELRALYNAYRFFQNGHRSDERRLMAYDGDIKGTTKSPYVTADVREALIEHHAFALGKFKDAEKALKKAVREMGEWEWMKDAYGMTEITAAFLLSHVDIAKAKYPSSIWHFFGFTPKDSAGVKGRNPGKGKLRSALWAALGLTLINKNGPYRPIYDTYRAREVGDKQARFRLIKLWLSHLWDRWRRYEGLPVTEPYAHNHLGHDGFYDPEKFGWPEL